MLGTNLVSRTKQALINICVKLAVRLIFSLALWPSPGACHVPCHSLSPPVHQYLPVKFSGGWGMGVGSLPHCLAGSQTSFSADPRCCGAMLRAPLMWAHGVACRRALPSRWIQLLPGSPLPSQPIILDAHRHSGKRFRRNPRPPSRFLSASLHLSLPAAAVPRRQGSLRRRVCLYLASRSF